LIFNDLFFRGLALLLNKIAVERRIVFLEKRIEAKKKNPAL